MNVIVLHRRPTQGAWSEAELAVLSDTLAIGCSGHAWETGITESGDAQFYLLGPLPEQACELCVSRLGGRYVLEDGAGRLLFEHNNLARVASHSRAALRGRQWPLVARIVMVWCTIRHMIHERLEPLMTEGEDLLVHFAPQLAAFV